MSSDPTRRDTLQAMGAMTTLAFLGWFGDDDDTSLDPPGILENPGIAELYEDDERPTPIASDIDWLILKDYFEFDDSGGEVTVTIDTEALEEDLTVNIDADGLTNPLVEDLDADGHNIENVNSLSVESTDITGRVIRAWADDGTRRDFTIDDYDHIGHAVEAVYDDLASVGKIELPEGQYQATADVNLENTTSHAAIIAVRSGTTLVGQGPKTIIKLEDDFGYDEEYPQVIANKDFSGDEDIVIKDLVVDGNRQNQTEDLSGGQWEGIDLEGVRDVYIDGVYAINCGDDGIDVDGDARSANRNRITNCYLESNNGWGIHLSGGAHETTVSGCITKNNGHGPRDRGGIDAPGCDNLVISGNVSINDNKGIFVWSHIDGEWRVVANNVISSPSDHGIMSDDENVIIANNVVKNGDRKGIDMSEGPHDEPGWNLIVGNGIYGMEGDGIGCAHGPVLASSNIVDDVNGRGIVLSGGSEGSIVTNNYIRDTGATAIRNSSEGTMLANNRIESAGLYALDLNSAVDAIVTGNVIVDGSRYGIIAGNATGGVLTIASNTIRGFDNEAVRIDVAQDARIRSNSLENCNRGIAVSSDANGGEVIIRSNDILDSADQGMLIGDVDNIVIQSNFIAGSGDDNIDIRDADAPVIKDNISRRPTGNHISVGDSATNVVQEGNVEQS